MTTLTLGLVGLVVGFLLSVPPTGPVALLVVRNLAREQFGRGLRIGLGTTFADLPYAVLGAMGYGYVIAEDPLLSPLFDGIGALVLAGISVHLLRTPVVERRGEETIGSPWSDLATGFVLGIINPTQILSWSVAASVGPVVPGAAMAPILAWATAASVGQALWWLVLSWTWRRFRSVAERGKWWLLRGSGVLGLAVALDLAIRVARALA